MIDVKQMLARQAAWQKSRRDLPWAEKIRQAAALRNSIQALSRSIAKDHPHPKKG